MNGTAIVTWPRSGNDEGRVVAEPLDDAEEVVPAAGVQARRRARAARTGSRPSRTRRGWSRSGRSPGSSRAGCPSAAWRVEEHVVPEARLEVATRAWAGRGRGRSRAPAPRPRRGTGTARRRTGWPTSARRRRGRWRSSRCQPRGRTSERGRRARPAGRPCPRATRTSSVAADGVAERHLAADDVRPASGDRASSRSAMNTRAPELRALIIIFGSAGPVISTRRSSRSGGAGGDRPVGAADLRGRRPGSPAARRPRSARGAPPGGGAGRARSARNRRSRSAEERERVGGQDVRRCPGRPARRARRPSARRGHAASADRGGRSPRSARVARSSRRRSRPRSSPPNGDRSTMPVVEVRQDHP